MRTIIRVWMVLFLLITCTAAAAALDGNWKLNTAIVQVVDNGAVLGFSDPSEANRIERIRFNDDKAVIYYGEKVYEGTYRAEGNMHTFTLSGKELPVVIALLRIDSDTYQFGYALADAKEELNSALGNSGFVNYIGQMVRQ